jgi:hypothetical protein
MWPRWAWVAVIAVAALAATVWSVVSLHGPVAGDDSEHVTLSAPSIGLQPGQPTTLHVTPRAGNLSAVGVYFGTYKGTISCDLQATLSDGPHVVSDRTLPCSSLGDNVITLVAQFPQIAASQGEQLDLQLAVTPDSANGPAVWTSADGTPDVVTRYGGSGSGLAVLSTIVERIDRYAPGWFGPATGGLLVVIAIGALVVAVVARRSRWALVAIVVLALARGMLWSVVIPPLQGMDEGAHFANAQYIATTGHLPGSSKAAEAALPPYSASLDVTSHAMGVSDQTPTDRPDYSAAAADQLKAADAAAGTSAGGDGAASGYPPGYYAPAALFYLMAPNDTVAQVAAIRIWSVLLGAAAAAFVWLFAGEATRDRQVQNAVAIAFVLQPMVAHQSAIVNNDIWVIAAGSAALWLGMKMIRTDKPLVTMAWAGVAVGLGLLGKPFAAAAILPVVAGWFIRLMRGRRWREALVQAGVAAAGAVVLFGGWLFAGRLLGAATGTTFPTRSNTLPTDLVTFLATQWDPHLTVISELWVRQFWGNFGWVNTPLPLRAYNLLEIGAIATVVLGGVWLVGWLVARRRRATGLVELDAPIGLSAFSIAGTLVFLYGIEYVYFVSSGRIDLLQGRYLLLLAGAALLLPPALVGRITASTRLMRATAWVMVACVVALHVVALRQIVMHYYV